MRAEEDAVVAVVDNVERCEGTEGTGEKSPPEDTALGGDLADNMALTDEEEEEVGEEDVNNEEEANGRRVC